MFSRVQPIGRSNPRKRQKRSHSSDTDEGPSNHPPAMPFAPSLPHTTTGGEQHTCHHEQALKRLEPDLDAMRGLITCKICQRFLSEPYGLACGHTYCYVCLDAWVVAQRKRTCPDCRAVIRQEPIPSFLIREMTRVFAYRAELLPDGETVEEHDEYIKEAVAKVAADREGEGLFRGMFKNERMHWMPIHDPGDDVDRCPVCHWELEDGRCGSCGLHVGDEDGFGLSEDESESESDSEEEDLDRDVVPHDHDGLSDPGSFDEEGFMDEEGEGFNQWGDSEQGDIDLDVFGPMPIPAAALRRSRNHPHQIRAESEPESEDSEDPEHDPQMDGFLVDDEPESSDSDSNSNEDSEEEAEETPRHPRRLQTRPIAIDSDSDTAAAPRRPVVIDMIDSDSDEEGPVARGVQRSNYSRVNRRPQQPIDVSSSGDDSEEDANNDNAGDGISNSDSGADSDSGGVDAGGFSPLQHGGDSEADSQAGNYGYQAGNHGYQGYEGDSDDGRGPTELDNGWGNTMQNGYDYSGATDNDEDEHNTNSDMYPDDEDANDYESDDGDSTQVVATPPPTTELEPNPTHRLNKRQRRRKRNADRAAGSVAVAGSSSNAALRHPFQLEDTLAELNSEHERQQRARMRRIQGRDRLREE